MAETALYFCICHLVIGLKTNLAARLLRNLRLLCCICSRSRFRLPNNTLFLNCIGGLHSTVPIYIAPAPSIFTSPITTSFNTLSISRCFFKTWPNPLIIPKLSNYGMCFPSLSLNAKKNLNGSTKHKCDDTTIL